MSLPTQSSSTPSPLHSHLQAGVRFSLYLLPVALFFSLIDTYLFMSFYPTVRAACMAILLLCGIVTCIRYAHHLTTWTVQQLLMIACALTGVFLFALLERTLPYAETHSPVLRVSSCTTATDNTAPAYCLTHFALNGDTMAVYVKANQQTVTIRHGVFNHYR